MQQLGYSAMPNGRQCGRKNKGRASERERPRESRATRRFYSHWSACRGEVANRCRHRRPCNNEVMWLVGHDELQAFQTLKELILPQKYD